MAATWEQHRPRWPKPERCIREKTVKNQEPKTPGARLKKFWHAWDQHIKDPWACKVIQEGLKLEFWDLPRDSNNREKKEFLKTTEEKELIEKEITEFLQKGAIEETTETENLFISNLFVIKQKQGKKRAVLDARRLNRHIRYAHFKMENIGILRKAIQKNDWTVKIDIKDAYLHVPMHADSKRFLAFRWKGKTYQFKAMPFGISSAPRVFTKLIRAALAPLRKQGIRILAYLDDFLLMASTKAEAEKQARLVKKHLEMLGFILNDLKCIWEPAQQQEFL